MPWPAVGPTGSTGGAVVRAEKAAGDWPTSCSSRSRSEPAALVAAGFTFQDEDVRDVLAAALTR